MLLSHGTELLPRITCALENNATLALTAPPVLTVPAVAATGLFVFMIAWNEFLFALLFLVEERNNWTVSLGVSQLTNIETPATTLMAGSVILTLPIIVLFLFAERLMTEGLTRGAEKG